MGFTDRMKSFLLTICAARASQSLSGSAAVRSNLAALPIDLFSPAEVSLCLSLPKTSTCWTPFDRICDEAAKQRETASRGHCALWLKTRRKKLLPHGKARRHNIIAKNLAMSTPTLARRLASEGTTFEEVVHELRQSLALQYIRTPSISLSQIAWLLGYEGGTSFSHAFRRWTGGPPSAARVERLLPAPAWSLAFPNCMAQNFGARDHLSGSWYHVARSRGSPRGQAEADSPPRAEGTPPSMKTISASGTLMGKKSKHSSRMSSARAWRKLAIDRPARLIPSKTLCASCVTALECGAQHR